MNELLNRVRETHVPRGSAALWWLCQMGLLVKMGETVLCVDYFATEIPERQAPPPVPAGEMAGVDIFLGTHDHLDHIDHESWRTWAETCPGAVFVFPERHRQAVLADGIDAGRCRGLNDGESVRIGEITVRAVAAAHEFLDPDPVSGFRVIPISSSLSAFRPVSSSISRRAPSSGVSPAKAEPPALASRQPG